MTGDIKFCSKCGTKLPTIAIFCTKCGADQVTNISQTSSARETVSKSPSIIQSAKKGFGTGAKVGFVVGLVFFLIIVIVAFAGSSSNTAPNTSTPEQQAINFVQNYRGPNGTGNSIVEVASDVINIEYAGQDISSNPSTSIGWMGLPHYDPNSSNVWEVDFNVKTYRENTKIVFYVNMDTHTIYSGDETAKNILDIVNTSNKSVSNNTS